MILLPLAMTTLMVGRIMGTMDGSIIMMMRFAALRIGVHMTDAGLYTTPKESQEGDERENKPVLASGFHDSKASGRQDSCQAAAMDLPIVSSVGWTSSSRQPGPCGPPAPGRAFRSAALPHGPVVLRPSRWALSAGESGVRSAWSLGAS